VVRRCVVCADPAACSATAFGPRHRGPNRPTELRADLALPHHAQDLGALQLPALDRLSAGAQLGMIVWLEVCTGLVKLIPQANA